MKPELLPTASHPLSGTRASEEPSAAAIMASMAQDAKQLGEKYVELAKIEIAAELKRASAVAAFAVAAAVLLLVGALILLLGACYALNEAAELPHWLSFVLVGLAACAGGGGLLLASAARARDSGGKEVS